MSIHDTASTEFFRRLTACSWLIVVASAIIVAICASALSGIVKDTTADAFIDPEHPILGSRDEIRRVFGLRDPIIVTIADNGPEGIYRPKTLAFVSHLTEKISRLKNVDPDGVTSLATEDNIVGTAEGLIVEPILQDESAYFEAEPGSPERAAEIRAAVEATPLYVGSLVARSGKATVIAAELLDADNADQTYEAIRKEIAKAPAPSGIEVHVAGEGAVAGSLASYIDRDASRLSPLVALAMAVVLAIAFRSVGGIVLPMAVILASVVGTLAVVVVTGSSFYVITNGLVVCLFGIAVADSVHIYSHFRKELSAQPNLPKREAVVRAMSEMWRPVTFTTLTTAAGFMALGLSSEVPPVQQFGYFGAIGVMIAGTYSMVFLPACLCIWPQRGSISPAAGFAREFEGRGFGASVGRRLIARPWLVVAASAAFASVAIYGTAQVRVDDARIYSFGSEDPIVVATELINREMDGSYYLDVLVETPEPDGLLDPLILSKIDELQTFLETLPSVNGTTSIVGYVKQLNRAVNEGGDESYVIPEDPALIAQLLFLLRASGDPTYLRQKIDAANQKALIRAHVDAGNYATARRIVPEAERFAAQLFPAEKAGAIVSGAVALDYHWLSTMMESHAAGVALSLLTVTLIASVLFRSVAAGLLLLCPMLLPVLTIYAMMGFFDLPLGISTSMFAAITIGLGVDFSIHVLDRIKAYRTGQEGMDEALLSVYFRAGPALFTNLAAVAVGFGVLCLSEVPPLATFGAFVAVAVGASYVSAIGMLPALVKLVKPNFLGFAHSQVLKETAS